MRRNPELTLARKAKRAGLTKEFYLTTREKAIRASGKNQGWRASEIAMAVTDIAIIANRVWSEKKGAAS